MRTVNRTLDLNPLYRSVVGFDRLANFLEDASRLDAANAYPPFNIKQLGEDEYRIELAVAGFTPDELDVEVHDRLLTVRGRKEEQGEDGEEQRYLHRGIAKRAFERRFHLADHVVVQSADMAHGLLIVELRRQLPEALKPRRIAIAGAAPAAELEAEQNAEAA